MQVLKEDIRGRILAVAKLQFGQKGYSKTSMREIAELAGVGVGNIYNFRRQQGAASGTSRETSTTTLRAKMNCLARWFVR